MAREKGYYLGNDEGPMWGSCRLNLDGKLLTTEKTISLANKLEYLLLQQLFAAICKGSFDRGYRRAEGLGRLICRVAVKHRKRADESLALAFPNLSAQARYKITAEVFVNVLYNLVELIKFPEYGASYFENQVSCTGLEHLQAALSRGHGVVNAVGHFGNWELMVAYYASVGLPVSAVYRRIKNPLLDQYILQRRSSVGVEMIRTSAPPGKFVSALKRNRVLVLVADQDARSAGVFVDFLGRAASTARGPAVLSRISKAPLITSYMVRKPDHTHKLQIDAPLGLPQTRNTEADILAVTAAFSERLECYVREHPGQWFNWLHRRWKTQP